MSSKEGLRGYVCGKTIDTLQVQLDDSSINEGEPVNVTGMTYDTAKNRGATAINTRVIITFYKSSKAVDSIDLESRSGPAPKTLGYRAQQLASDGASTKYEPGTGIYYQPPPAGASGRGDYAAAGGTPSSSGGGVNTPESSAASGRGGYASSSGGGVNTPGSSAASKDGGN